MIYWQYNKETDSYKCKRSGATAPASGFRPSFPTDVQIDAYVHNALEFWAFDPDTVCWERSDGKTLSAACVLDNPTPMLLLTDHYLDYLVAKGPTMPETDKIAAAANKLGRTLFEMEMTHKFLQRAKDSKAASIQAAIKEGEANIQIVQRNMDARTEAWQRARTKYLNLMIQRVST